MNERESGHDPMLVQIFCRQMLSVRNNAGGRGGLSQGRLEVEVGLVVVCPCLTSCLVLRTLSSGASSAPRETCRSSSCRQASGQTQRTWSWNHKYYMDYTIITNKVCKQTICIPDEWTHFKHTLVFPQSICTYCITYIFFSTTHIILSLWQLH